MNGRYIVSRSVRSWNLSLLQLCQESQVSRLTAMLKSNCGDWRDLEDAVQIAVTPPPACGSFCLMFLCLSPRMIPTSEKT